MKPIVIIVIEGPESQPRAGRRAAELGASGFETRVCVGATALRRALQETRAEEVAVVVVLDGDASSNNTKAQLVATLYPECRVVCLLDDSSDARSITALQSGADVCYPSDVSSDMLSSALYSLLRRWRVASRPASPPVTLVSAFWQLTQQAWVLEGPKNCVLPLTTSERAFLLHLMQQPDLRASYEALMRAVHPASTVSMRVAQARLGVMVSRLRQKLQHKHGLELPVKSLHKWGYMFTGEIGNRLNTSGWFSGSPER